MKIISHRGNLNGRIPDMENHPYYIMKAISAGFDVEVDVWYKNGQYFLGHDAPEHVIDEQFLHELPLWCHAKNADALGRMASIGVHCFWHESDTYTLTSRNMIWCYVGKRHERGITVFLDEPPSAFEPVYGVCTDYPIKWKDAK